MAILLMILASACFVSMSAMVKGLGNQLPLSEIIFFRCLLPLPFLAYRLIRCKRKLIVTAWKLILLRSLCGLLAMAAFYFSVSNMPIAACIFIGRSQPLLVACFAPLILHENTPFYVWWAIALGLVGVSFLIQPALQWSFAAMTPFGGACISALAHLFVRKLNRTDTPLTIIFNFFVISAIISLFLTLGTFTVPSWPQSILLIGIAVFASIGQYLMTLAYRLELAPIVSASSYSSVLLSIIYGYFFWGELPTWEVWLGGSLILAGSTFLFIRSRQSYKRLP